MCINQVVAEANIPSKNIEPYWDGIVYKLNRFISPKPTLNVGEKYMIDNKNPTHVGKHIIHENKSPKKLGFILLKNVLNPSNIEPYTTILENP